MDQIVKLDRFEARQLLEELKDAAENGGIYSLRVHVSGNDQAKFKINSRMWSPPVGSLDPECSLALRRNVSDWAREMTYACCTSSIGQPCAHKQ